MFGQSFLFGSIAAARARGINYLIISGGAGGGSAGSNFGGGGGGAGGLITSYTSNRDANITPTDIIDLPSATVLTITIGSGGAAGTGGEFIAGSNGTSSIISATGLTTISPSGGGGGGGRTLSGNSGGSGGGAGGGATGAGAGTANQG